MTGKIIDFSATAILILILPIAFLTVVLFKAWPLLLALFLFTITWQVWQRYQWRRWSQQVNPFFNQLIKENQGCLTAMDLSLKANLSGWAAQQFLEKKAEEFGAQRKVYKDKGTVYYFLTASALGSIFDESTPTLELEYPVPTTVEPSLVQPPIEAEPEPIAEPVSVAESTSELNPLANHEDIADKQRQPPPEFEHQSLPEAEKADSSESSLLPNQLPQPLIQAELAKRLEVHSSTVGKRKSDPDFAEWSQSKDPDGIAWTYLAETKEFLPMEKT